MICSACNEKIPKKYQKDSMVINGNRYCLPCGEQLEIALKEEA